MEVVMVAVKGAALEGSGCNGSRQVKRVRVR